MIYIPRTPLGNFVIVLDFHLKVFLFHCNIHGQQIRQTLNGCNGVNQQFQMPNEVVWPLDNLPTTSQARISSESTRKIVNEGLLSIRHTFVDNGNSFAVKHRRW